MKRLFLAAALGVVCVSAFGQGTLNFANAGVGLQAKVTTYDGIGLSGSAWDADLFWAPGVVTDSSLLTALNQPATFSTVPSQAGFFIGGPRTIPGVPGGSFITAQVRVWDSAAGSSWAQAITWTGNYDTMVGESVLFGVYLANQNAFPPGIPTTMDGLNGHPWSVGLIFIPEPSTLALAGLGLAATLVVRHRTSDRDRLLNHSAATNPAITIGCHAEAELRRFVDRNRSAE